MENGREATNNKGLWASGEGTSKNNCGVGSRDCIPLVGRKMRR